jgi:hypothetical protein
MLKLSSSSMLSVAPDHRETPTAQRDGQRSRTMERAGPPQFDLGAAATRSASACAAEELPCLAVDPQRKGPPPRPDLVVPPPPWRSPA